MCCFLIDVVSFKFKDHAFREDEQHVFLEIILEDPAMSDMVIQVNSYDVTATG